MSLMRTGTRAGWRRRWPEFLLTLTVLVGFAFTVRFFLSYHYLPVPFFYEPSDTFMDWFNTAYWAYKKGAYDVWYTVYPPISFVFLRIFSIDGCYLYSPIYARDCDLLSKLSIVGFYFVNVILAFYVFVRNNVPNARLRALAFAVSLPLLFALERGNLIGVTLVFFILAFGYPFKRSWVRWLALAFSINFKPYIILSAVSFLIKREWRALEITGMFCIVIYAVCYALIGEGSPFELLNNLRSFSSAIVKMVFEQIYYSTSYSSIAVLDMVQFPVRRFIESRTVEWINFLIPNLILFSVILMLITLVSAWTFPNIITSQRVTAIILSTSFIVQNPGGYSMVFVIFLVFLEDWKRVGPIIAITCAYLLCIPFDWEVSRIAQNYTSSWLSGQTVFASYGVAAGIFVRPGLLLLLHWSLCIDSILQVIRAHRSQRPMLGLGTPAMARTGLEPAGASA